MKIDNPADKHIIDLIEELCSDASRMTTPEDRKQKNIDRIVALRASMNPTIIVKSE